MNAEEKKFQCVFNGRNVLSTTLSVKDSYCVNPFDAVLNVNIASFKERYNKNNIIIIISCDKPFLIKIFLNDNGLKQIDDFYNVNSDVLQTERRMCRKALSKRNTKHENQQQKLF